MEQKKIYIVGIGPGCEEQMTGQALAALDRAEELYFQAAVRMFRFIKAGMALAKPSH